jgi:hypothetical protein
MGICRETRRTVSISTLKIEISGGESSVMGKEINAERIVLGYVNKTAEERSECLAAGAGSKSEPKRG